MSLNIADFFQLLQLLKFYVIAEYSGVIISEAFSQGL